MRNKLCISACWKVWDTLEPSSFLWEFSSIQKSAIKVNYNRMLEWSRMEKIEKLLWKVANWYFLDKRGWMYRSIGSFEAIAFLLNKTSPRLATVVCDCRQAYSTGGGGAPTPPTRRAATTAVWAAPRTSPPSVVSVCDVWEKSPRRPHHRSHNEKFQASRAAKTTTRTRRAAGRRAWWASTVVVAGCKMTDYGNAAFAMTEYGSGVLWNIRKRVVVNRCRCISDSHGSVCVWAG